MKDIFLALLWVWFVGIPVLALYVVLFLLAVGIFGLPLWLIMWWAAT